MSESHLRRYNKLQYLLDILKTNKLPLLDPVRWEDKNDSRFLDFYKKKKGLKTVLALCFAEAPETYLHWKAYAGYSSGVCIEFYRDELISRVKCQDGLLQDYIKYELLDKLRNSTPAIDDLPFVKRYAYSGEKEFRVIYTSVRDVEYIEYISISPKDIKKILINPWVKSSVYKSMREKIEKTKGWEKVKVRRSMVTKNDEWGKIGAMAVEGERRYVR